MQEIITLVNPSQTSHGIVGCLIKNKVILFMGVTFSVVKKFVKH